VRDRLTLVHYDESQYTSGKNSISSGLIELASSGGEEGDSEIRQAGHSARFLHSKRRDATTWKRAWQIRLKKAF